MFGLDRRHRWASPIGESTRDPDYYIPRCAVCGIRGLRQMKEGVTWMNIAVRTFFEPSPLWERLSVRLATRP